jgi:cytochrome c
MDRGTGLHPWHAPAFLCWQALVACSAPEPGQAAAPAPPAPVAERAPARPPSLERGRELYQQQCAVCHGDQGDGLGSAAYLLSPLPRDFGSGRFRLVSTENSVPSDEDLMAVLRRGMPGSAMPAFEWLSDEDRASLALQVRELARAGIVRGLRLLAEEEGEEFDEAEALAIAAERTTPGAPIELGPPPPETPELLARGRELYATSCAQCHGEDGRARAVEVQWNEDGTPTRPRDFTAGIFKGGSRREDIVRRLRCGLPGSPMPSTELARPEDAWALAGHVESLVRPGAEERVLVRRQTLRARRLQALPEEPGSPAWAALEPTYLALMPLWWRDERCEGLELRAAHDGQRIAILLTWPDATRDQELLGTESFSDLAALQLTALADPPLLTMGEAGNAVNIWNWKAAWELEREGPRDVSSRYPNLSADLYGYQPESVAPLFLTARAVENPMAAEHRCCPGEELTAQGFGTLAPLPRQATTLDVSGQWQDGHWSVLFTRPLEGGGPGVVPLVPGQSAHLAAAIWDGAAGDRNGQKSVTVWQRLELER